MTATHEDLVTWLQEHRWQQKTDGPLGALWAPPGGSDDDLVGVLHGIDEQAREWNPTIQRVAEAEEIEPTELHRFFAGLWVDEVEFVARGTRRDALPLVEANLLMQVASTAVRTTATTAIAPRGAIRGGYLAGGERVVKRVEFAHTRPGSFVMPVRYRILRHELDEEAAELQDQLSPEFTRVENLETEERKASRTLMLAMSTVVSDIIQPAREPGAAAIADITARGVTSELLLAVRDYLRSPDETRSLQVRAQWAGKLKDPAGVPGVIQAERSTEAAELLERTALRMREQRRDDQETVSGPVVGVRLLETVRDERTQVPSVATIQAARKGRTTLIDVEMPREHFSNVTEWLTTGEAVQGRGEVRSRGGRLHLDLVGELRSLRNPTLPGV